MTLISNIQILGASSSATQFPCCTAGEWSSATVVRPSSGATRASRASKRLDPPSLLRDALIVQSGFGHRLDITDPWSCDGSELMELLAEAPPGFLCAFVYGIYECRTRWGMSQEHAALAGGDAQLETVSTMAARLEDELLNKASMAFTYELESTDVFSCSRKALDKLLSAAPTGWRGYLVAITQWRAMTDAILAS